MRPLLRDELHRSSDGAGSGVDRVGDQLHEGGWRVEGDSMPATVDSMRSRLGDGRGEQSAQADHARGAPCPVAAHDGDVDGGTGHVSDVVQGMVQPTHADHAARTSCAASGGPPRPPSQGRRMLAFAAADVTPRSPRARPTTHRAGKRHFATAGNPVGRSRGRVVVRDDACPTCRHVAISTTRAGPEGPGAKDLAPAGQPRAVRLAPTGRGSVNS